MSHTSELTYREGRPSDLRTTFDLSEVALHGTGQLMGIVASEPPDGAELDRRWERQGGLAEFLAAQPGSYWICEEAGQPVGFCQVRAFGAMEELTQLMVLPSHQGRGIARNLIRRCWPGDPTPEVGRVVVAVGAPGDLTLYQEAGVMPVAGHWHLRVDAGDYRLRRSHEIDAVDPPVVVLEMDRAVTEWKLLEPPAIGHERPQLHEFFGRTRTCLAIMAESGEHATALCWVGPDGEIGPAVGRTQEELVPLVLQALDRVASSMEPEALGLFCATDSWWMLRRLHALGFRVWWPSWMMSSVPLPGLDRYLPTRPTLLL